MVIEQAKLVQLLTNYISVLVGVGGDFICSFQKNKFSKKQIFEKNSKYFFWRYMPMQYIISILFIERVPLNLFIHETFRIININLSN